MIYGDEESNPKSGSSMKSMGRIAALVFLIVGGRAAFPLSRHSLHPDFKSSGRYRGRSDSGDQADANSRSPLTVPSTGEIVGLETTPVPTPNTPSGSSEACPG